MFLRRLLCIWILTCFFLSSIVPSQRVYADTVTGLPKPGAMVSLSSAFEPVLIKGLKVHPENPFLFDFIVDTGNTSLTADNAQLKAESNKLIKYFLAAMTVPEKDLWVNLSPYEKDRIIASNLGETEMGRDMLAQDYILKQLTASLIYPESHLGKTFWDKVYAKAQAMYGTTDIPVNTFNKVWIVADKADVFERANVAYVVGAHLKVMLEEDYMAMTKHYSPPLVGGARGGGVSQNPPSLTLPTKGEGTNNLGSQIIRDIVLPELEHEVNEGQNFAPLRQMYYSMILASWYKMALKDAVLTQIYGNQSKVKLGINQADSRINEAIFNQYLQAYKKGVFNYIKEDVNQVTREASPRKYFSGGEDFAVLATEAIHRKSPWSDKAVTGRIFEVRTPVHVKTSSNGFSNSANYFQDSAMTTVSVDTKFLELQNTIPMSFDMQPGALGVKLTVSRNGSGINEAPILMINNDQNLIVFSSGQETVIVSEKGYDIKDGDQTIVKLSWRGGKVFVQKKAVTTDTIMVKRDGVLLKNTLAVQELRFAKGDEQQRIKIDLGFWNQKLPNKLSLADARVSLKLMDKIGTSEFMQIVADSSKNDQVEVSIVDAAMKTAAESALNGFTEKIRTYLQSLGKSVSNGKFYTRLGDYTPEEKTLLVRIQNKIDYVETWQAFFEAFNFQSYGEGLNLKRLEGHVLNIIFTGNQFPIFLDISSLTKFLEEMAKKSKEKDKIKQLISDLTTEDRNRLINTRDALIKRLVTDQFLVRAVLGIEAKDKAMVVIHEPLSADDQGNVRFSGHIIEAYSRDRVLKVLKAMSKAGLTKLHIANWQKRPVPVFLILPLINVEKLDISKSDEEIVNAVGKEFFGQLMGTNFISINNGAREIPYLSITETRNMKVTDTNSEINRIHLKLKSLHSDFWKWIKESIDHLENTRIVDNLTQAQPTGVDAALVAAPGGIDLDRSKMQMNIQKQGEGVQMKFDQAMVARIKQEGFEGLEFKIESIVPVANLLLLLGVSI
ncbi:MAG: hypothetical protein HQL15_03625 [Candidatus Omnitrophica bacterium]|nr:hypothetical protein [Candidatus Omnitrophota bacterium]